MQMQRTCSCCAQELREENRVSAWWKKIASRADFCLACFGEIFFDIIPQTTSARITTLNQARTGGRWAIRLRPGGNEHPNNQLTGEAIKDATKERTRD